MNSEGKEGLGLRDVEAAILARAAEFARRAHADAGPAHDFSHVERVGALARRLGASLGAEPFCLEMAALLHDVGRSLDRRGDSQGADRHEELSVEMARPFLEALAAESPEAALALNPKRLQTIFNAILRHRHRRARPAQSPEDRCLYDADKLDSLGAVGVARAYLWLGEFGRSVFYPRESYARVSPSDNSVEVDSLQREWEIKLAGLKDSLLTEEGRRIAQARHDRMREFLGDLEDEVQGIK